MKRALATVAALALSLPLLLGAAASGPTITPPEDSLSYVLPDNARILKTEKLPFAKLTVETDKLPTGVTVVKTAGLPGTGYRIALQETTVGADGEEKKLELIKDVVAMKPVDELTLVGTGPVVDAISSKTAQAEAAKAAAAAKAEAERKAAEEAAALAARWPGSAFNIPTHAPEGYTSPADNRAYVKGLLFPEEFVCADYLINKESGYRSDALNESSGAYGLPQSLPGNKMASEGSDWVTNGKTQFNWMRKYVVNRYGSFCNAAEHSRAHNWY